MSIELADEAQDLRGGLEAAFAAHTASPDVTSVVNRASEEHSREIRTRNEAKPADKHQHEAADVSGRRTAIRDAINEAKLKAAQGPSESQGAAPAPTAAEVPAGPPASWDATAKALWHQLPQEVRLATQRGEAAYKAAIDNHPGISQFNEISEAIKPLRPLLQQNGIHSDAHAVKQLLNWEARFRNPETRPQAFAELAQQYGYDLPQGRAQQPQYAPEDVAGAERAISQFSNRPHFAALSPVMGGLIQADPGRYVQPDGSVNLELAYRDASNARGLSTNRPRAPSSPSGRSPGAVPNARGGASVRASLTEAIRANSGRV